MKIEISQPLAFSELGQRANNEDKLFPEVGWANKDSSLFLVCDGIGGADKGEEASRLLCKGISEYYEGHNFPFINQSNLQQALANVYTKFDEFIEQHPLISRIGSTLTILQLHEKGVVIAHLGDSRVYHFREGKIIFQTKDHKHVTDLVDAGIITEEQAKVHPWRNKLSKAVISYNKITEESRKTDTPDIFFISDIQTNDCFFLCTDGVLEQLNNNLLENIISQENNDCHKIGSLLSLCQSKTKDNYSGYFIRVTNVIINE